MRILFAGTEGEYASAIRSRGDEASFSLFFSGSDHLAPHDCAPFDAIVVAASRFLRTTPSCTPCVTIVYGPVSLMTECFDAGCDDFIREPLTGDELHARIQARAGEILRMPGSQVRLASCSLEGPAGTVRLPPGACKVLSLLARNGGAPVPRKALTLTVVAGSQGNCRRPRAVDMTISRIRKALCDVGAPALADLLQCSNGAYRLDRPDRSARQNRA